MGFMIRFRFLVLGAVAGVFSASGFAQFGNGNLAVVRLTPSPISGSAGSTVDLVEINALTGVATGNIIPLTYDATNRPNGLTIAGNTQADGGFSTSAGGNGILAGYAVGSGGVINTATTARRVVKVNYNNGALTAQDIPAIASPTAVRAAVSLDGNNFFLASSSGVGLHSGSFGSSTTTGASGSDTNIRQVVAGNNGSVYYSINGTGGAFVKAAGSASPIWTGAASFQAINDFAISTDGLTMYAAVDISVGTGSPGQGVFRFTRSNTGTAFTGTGTKIYNGIARYISIAEGTSEDSLFVTVRATGAASELVRLDNARSASSLLTATWSNPLSATAVWAGQDVVLGAVPEPATMAALGLGALGLLRRRKTK